MYACELRSVFFDVSGMFFWGIHAEVFAADYTISGSQTSQQNVVTGDTVTVTGTGNLNVSGTKDGISGASADNVTVTVQTGGQITASGANDAGDGYNAI